MHFFRYGQGNTMLVSTYDQPLYSTSGSYNSMITTTYNSYSNFTTSESGEMNYFSCFQ